MSDIRDEKWIWTIRCADLLWEDIRSWTQDEEEPIDIFCEDNNELI